MKVDATCEAHAVADSGYGLAHRLPHPQRITLARAARSSGADAVSDFGTELSDSVRLREQLRLRTLVSAVSTFFGAVKPLPF